MQEKINMAHLYLIIANDDTASDSTEQLVNGSYYLIIFSMVLLKDKKIVVESFNKEKMSLHPPST